MTLGGARILLTADAVGGVWTHALDLAAGLAGAGASVRVCLLGPPPHDMGGQGIDLVHLPHPLEWLAADAGQVREGARAVAHAARAWGADLVHLHSPAFAIVDTGCPIVATNHSCVATWWAALRGGPLPPDLRWRAALVAEGLHRADLVLAPSCAYADAVAATYGLAAAPLAVHNGRTAPSADGDGAHEADEVFTAGRLWDEGKSIAVLDRAAAMLPWPVRAAGSPLAPDGARATFEHVDVLGRVPETAIRARLAARPVYAAPARFEPFGLAVLEAAQAGCALVLSDIATFRELWDGAALFVDAGDPAALAAALLALIDDRAARRVLGRTARARARRYTVARMVERTAAAYARCLARQPAAVGA